MLYLIDGHNLIPKLPDLSLQAMDDEVQLIGLLQEFCRRSRGRSRKQVEVYFDNAPPGQARTLTFGVVKAHFVSQGRAADDAIRARLSHLGHSARNWIVVSSDQQVQSDARAVHAQAVSSEAFARQLMATLAATSEANEELSDGSISAEEVESWLKAFQECKRDTSK